MTDTASEYDFSTGAEVQGTPETPGPNPAWNDVLNVLPEQFHPMVTPHFQKWDSAAQSRIESVNSQYEPYKAYQPFVEHGIGVDDIAQALRLHQAVNQSPREIYDALASAYGYGMAPVPQPNAENAAVQQMTGEAQQQPLADPRLDRLQQGVDLMANMWLQQDAELRANQADAELDHELSTLKQKHGDFNEDVVLTYMNNGLSADKAVEHYFNLRNEILTQHQKPFAPGILGGGSGNGAGVPSDAIDVTKLDSKGTRNLVAQMLEAAQRNG
jgi:hypothetical protein